jgi:hypothetical protein
MVEKNGCSQLVFVSMLLKEIAVYAEYGIIKLDIILLFQHLQALIFLTVPVISANHRYEHGL